VQGKVRALKAFASWLCTEGYTPDNLLYNLKLPRTPNNLINPLTNDEIDRLVSYQNPLTAIGCRNIAILITLLDTGLRVSELCNLSFEDAHIEEGYLKVMGKGSKERIVPIGALSQKMLWRYIIHFRPEPLTGSEDFLFLSLDGNRLKANAVKLLFNRWGKKAGVPRLHAHLCRHTYATNFLVHHCGDVFRLQQILGHTSLEMVRRYVHYASNQSLMNGKTASPMDHMGIKKLRGYKIDRVLKNNSNHNSRREHNGRQ
jgi:integrase/recombinase XerC/integrase/recombinase XerD